MTGFAHPVVVEFVVKTNLMEAVNRIMLFSVVINANVNVSFISVYGTSITCMCICIDGYAHLKSL